jgi:DNA-binding GntR family transcriptional regulator
LEFHRSIISASGSRSLESTWKALGINYWGYIGVYLRKLNLEEQAIRHQLICDALRDRDTEKVESVIKEHFSKVKISLLENDCTINIVR